MSIIPVPTAVSDIQAAFSSIQSSVSSSGLPAPTDPFSVLLDAAQSDSSATATSDADDAAASTASTSGSSSGYDAMLTSALTSGGTTSALSGTATDSSGTSASGAAIVAEATKEIGVPYVWGGTTPSGGFDCSGLVQYVFGQLGVSLPRTAAEQEQVGTPVSSLAQAQPGDLLFFEPGQNGAPAGEAGHVAIYIGDDKMIAAPETGEDVQIQTVPGTPLAIRRVNVPTASTGTTTSTGGSTELGNVSVPAAYSGMVEQAANATGTPASFLAAILQQESGFNPNAVSSTGAEGIAQFEPGTAASNGVSPFDPASAIPGAARLLSSYHSLFGSWSLAAAAYNAGVGAVEEAGGVPQNGQTPAYVADVMAMSGMEAGS